MIECIRVGHAAKTGKGEPGFTRKTPNADLPNAQGESMALHWFQGQRIEYRILRVPCFCVKRAGSFCIVVTFTFLVRLDYAEQRINCLWIDWETGPGLRCRRRSVSLLMHVP